MTLPREAQYFETDTLRKRDAGQTDTLGTVTDETAAVRLRDALERAHLDRVLTLRPTDRVLDLGGGAGRIALHLAPRVAEVVLVDASPALVEAAREAAAARGLTQVTCRVGDVMGPYPEGPFDVVIVFGVLMYLDDAALAGLAVRLATCVKPGGTLIVKEPVTTDGVPQEDVRRDAHGEIGYLGRFRPRAAYAQSLASHFAAVYQAPTCAHLVPAFLGGTNPAAARASSPGVSAAVDALTPLIVRANPRLQRLESSLRGGSLAFLLAPAPVVQDIMVFRRRVARPASPEPELSVVVIAFNEEVCITPVVWEMIDDLDAAGIDFELVLVDDGSRDATPARMAELAAAEPRIRLSPNPRNLGIGGALRNGFDAARGRFVTWVPGDGQIGPETIRTLFARRDEAPMLTTVYRSRDDAWYRHAISQTLNTIIRLRTGQVAKSGGNYLFRREAWRTLGPRDDDSMMISTAFRANLRAAGENIVEVGIDARARIAGHSKVLNPQTILRTLQAAIRRETPR